MLAPLCPILESYRNSYPSVNLLLISGNLSFQAWAQSLAEKDKTEVQEEVSPAEDVRSNGLDLRPEPEPLEDVQTRVLESGVTIKPTVKKKGKNKLETTKWS